MPYETYYRATFILRIYNFTHSMTKFHQKITMIGSYWGLQIIAEEEEIYFITLKANYSVVF